MQFSVSQLNRMIVSLSVSPKGLSFYQHFVPQYFQNKKPLYNGQVSWKCYSGSVLGYTVVFLSSVLCLLFLDLLWFGKMTAFPSMPHEHGFSTHVRIEPSANWQWSPSTSASWKQRLSSVCWNRQSKDLSVQLGTRNGIRPFHWHQIL